MTVSLKWKRLNRPCWWCGAYLMAISHAKIMDPLGNTLWVHKICKEDAENYFKQHSVVQDKSLTAQESPNDE